MLIILLLKRLAGHLRWKCTKSRGIVPSLHCSQSDIARCNAIIQTMFAAFYLGDVTHRSLDI